MFRLSGYETPQTTRTFPLLNKGHAILAMLRNFGEAVGFISSTNLFFTLEYEETSPF